MSKRQKQASAYLDLATYEKIVAIAQRHDRSLSTHLKYLIERDIADEGSRHEEFIAIQRAILIGVDALVKYHPNEKLFGVVKATRQTKLGSASDEA